MAVIPVYRIQFGRSLIGSKINHMEQIVINEIVALLIR
jgi:hypothetical protein